LVAARDAIGNAILTYFEQRIQPLLGSLLDEQGYVVDFALCGKLQSSESLESMSISDLMNRIKVIEVCFVIRYFPIISLLSYVINNQFL
jgi:hypothetical protein